MKKIVLWLLVSVLFQVGAYLYLDRVVLVPAVSFRVQAAAKGLLDGRAAYSASHRYMALWDDREIRVYDLPGKKLVKTVDFTGKEVTYLRWLPDRDLALVAFAAGGPQAGQVILTRLDPGDEVNDPAITINALPRYSKIVDVAYSTATNVVYMHVATPLASRVYRTDANRTLRRINLNTNRLGRIFTLADRDGLIYEDLATGTVRIREGSGSARIISPPGGKYRLVGVDGRDNIFVARLNRRGLAESIWEGRLQVGFRPFKNLSAPVDAATLTLAGLS